MQQNSIMDEIEDNYSKEYKNLVKTARRKLGDLFCEDCVQDCYERVVRRATTLTLRGELKYLMRGILNNRIKDYMREHIDMVEVEEYHIYGDETEDALIMTSAYQDVVERLESLDEKKRAALTLYFLEGIKTTSLAKIVEVEERTLSNWVKDFRRTFE